MKHKGLTLRKVVCMCGTLILLTTLSSAAPVEKSSRAAFVPEDIVSAEPQFRVAAVMGKRAGTLMSPQDPDRATLVTNVAPDFLRCTNSFLRPEFVPEESYARENLEFSRGVGLSHPNGPHKEGDAAYLSYRVDGRDFLISQTFDGSQSLIGISISLKPGEQFSSDRHDEIQTAMKALWDTYFLPDAEAPSDFVVEQSKGLDASLLSAKRTEGRVVNYRQTLKGTYSATGICLVFKKYRFYVGHSGDLLPAWQPPADKFFDWVLHRYEPDQSKSVK